MAEPKVRFKRDDGSSYPAWTIVPFSKLSVPSGIKNKNDADLESYSISNERGFVPQNEQFEDAGYLNNADRSLYYIVKPGSFAYNPARINIGSIGYQNVGKDVLVSSLYEIFNTTDELDDGFLMNWFKTEQFQKHVRRLSEGGVRQYFYYDKLCMVKFSLPCLEEQQKIADFLSSVDAVITASEEEVANLETQKKAVMKKIFSQEVRFKKADGTDFPEWKEKTLGELAVFSKGQGYTKSDLSETGSPIILYGRLYTKYQTVISEVDTFAEMKPRSVLSKKGDVIVPASGETAEDISVAAVVDADGIILGGDINIIHPCDAVLPNYLAYSLTFGTPHQEMAKRAQGKSIVHLHNDDLKAAVIIYPCLEEQRLIADFLSDFDEAIAAAKKELELWKELKKGLLQQMFV